MAILSDFYFHRRRWFSHEMRRFHYIDGKSKEEIALPL